MKRIPAFLVILICLVSPAYADTNAGGTGDPAISDDTTAAVSLLEKSLEVARGLSDYQVTLFKQERVGGVLKDEERMTFKWMRPFSVYIRVEEGKEEGQEIIYVKGENEDKMVVSPGGILGGITMKVAPDSGLVTRNNRHTITEAGITPTLERIISIITTDSGDPSSPIRVEYHDRVLFQEKPCSLIRVHENSYAYLTDIYLYRDTLLPAAFISYNEAGELIESYRYRDYHINIGLTDEDFDPDNDTYNF